MEHCSVIDRKKLKDALTCSGSPVNHLLEVIELTCSEIILSTEREHRYRCTRSLPVTSAESYLSISLYRNLILFRNIEEPSVLTLLPCDRSKSLPVSYENLVREWLGNIEGKIPYREIRIIKRNDLSPFLECLAAARKSKYFVRAKGWSSHLKNDIRTFSRSSLGCLSAEDCICKCR